MSLRARLIISFSMMVSLSIILGILLIASSWILRSRYVAYNRDRQLFDLLVETAQIFDKRRRALDGYLIGLESERDRFNVLEFEMEQIFKQWREIAVYPVDKKDLGDIETRLKSFRSGLDQIFRLVEKNRRSEAIQIMEATVLPSIDGIQKELKSLSVKKKSQSDLSWESAKKLTGKATFFSIFLLISVGIIGAGFSILLYQSVSQPLEKLRQGTKKIAQGEWNLKLNLTEPIELAELARSFEEMALSLSRLQAQVVQMDRMSAIGTLAGGVAHEINNPLTGVLGHAQLLMEKMTPDDPNRSNVEKIEKAAQRCKKIVRGLLDFSRSTDYFFQAIEVDHTIQSALSLCESEIAAMQIRIIWEKNPSLPKIMASLHHLQHVFLNVITNAMHAMPDGGTLKIETKVLSGDEVGDGSMPKILQAISGSPAGKIYKEKTKFVSISFTDTGVGIEQEYLSRIFDPFFTTKEVGKGTGLGLTISYGIVQQHHGQITGSSEGVGKGSAFTIQIPVVVEPDEKEDKGGKNIEEIEKVLARFDVPSSAGKGKPFRSEV